MKKMGTRFMVAELEKLRSQNEISQYLDHASDKPWRLTKIVAEALLAFLMLVVSMPIIAIALVLVRLTSRGSAIYAQRRLGRNGGVFTLYKIRTMYRDSEPDGARWCVPGDSRVTPVGACSSAGHILMNCLS